MAEKISLFGWNNHQNLINNRLWKSWDFGKPHRHIKLPVHHDTCAENWVGLRVGFLQNIKEVSDLLQYITKVLAHVEGLSIIIDALYLTNFYVPRFWGLPCRTSSWITHLINFSGHAKGIGVIYLVDGLNPHHHYIFMYYIRMRLRARSRDTANGFRNSVVSRTWA